MKQTAEKCGKCYISFGGAIRKWSSTELERVYLCAVEMKVRLFAQAMILAAAQAHTPPGTVGSA